MTRLGVLEATFFGQPASLHLGELCSSPGGELLIDLGTDTAVLLRASSATLEHWRKRTGSTESIGAVVGSQLLAYLGHDYASPEDIVGFAPSFLRELALKHLKNYASSSIGRTVLKGWFCSELVAVAYKDAGLPLTELPPGQVSPARLLRSHRTCKVKNAFFRLPSMGVQPINPQPPPDFTGRLSIQVVEQLLDQAKQSAGTHGIPAAADALKRQLLHLLKQTVPSLQTLYAYEKRLVAEGLLPAI